MKRFQLLVLLIFSIPMVAQTGIGTTTPHASAKLHVSATDKGFLPPRVTLTSGTDNTTIPSPAEGLLAYNIGSVGLQAGYYYWNGANWATIATGTTAGNAVIANDMVKLYSEVYSAAVGKIAHESGYSFTVPVSGRYLFDFSSTGYINQASFTFTFSVRQGTTVLASDFQTSANNNVHVEYSGKLEVNLQSGITYNVYVNSTGSRDSGDSDRVYYKLVAGNLPVNQHMAERNIQLNNNFLSNDGDDEGIRVDNSGNVTLNGSLSAGGNSYPTTQGTNGHSLTTNGSGITSWNSVPPVGVISAFAGSTAPSGYLLCDGSQVSRTAYSSLFAIIGTTYGVGNGTTTFNLPDLRGRSVFGIDNMGGTSANRLTTTGGISVNNTRGATGGTQNVTLVEANLPSHAHTFTGASSITSSDSHTHTYQDAYFAEGVSGGVNNLAGSGSTDFDNSLRWRNSSNGVSNSPQNINTGSYSHSHTVTASGTIG